MEKLDINIIKQLIKDEKIRWTNHIVVRLLQRNITQDDVLNTLLNGEIIEEYENDYPYPSCLIYGLTINEEIIHVVCGYNEEELWIITAYHPNTKEWNKDMKTRKESK